MARYIPKFPWPTLIPFLVVFCLPVCFEHGPAAQTGGKGVVSEETIQFDIPIERDLQRGGKHAYSFTLLHDSALS